jgi:manganese transport protein
MTAVEEAPGAQPSAAEIRVRGGVRQRLILLGPAFVAAIAYVDPGNFATNFSAGAQFGYLLVWVIVVANLLAMLIQTLSAKLGLATGRNLPELCRDHFPRAVTRGMWVQAELVAIATDLAEVIGGASRSTCSSASRFSPAASSPASSRSACWLCRAGASGPSSARSPDCSRSS